MPIDIRLLLQDKSASDIVRRWQMLRTGSNMTMHHEQGMSHDDNSMVDEAIRLKLHHREAQNRLEQYKKSCRNERKRPDSEKLKSYQKEYDNLGINLRKALWKIANAVDEPLLDALPQTLQIPKHNSKEARNGSGPNNILSSPYSRLIELGVLDSIGNRMGNGNIMPETLCWTVIGIDWAHAISRLAGAVMKLSDAKETEVLQLPSLLPMEASDLHDMLGCSQHCKVCNVCSMTDPVPSPPWLAYLKLNYSGQTLGDKQLPKVLNYSTILNMTTMSRSEIPSYLFDPREEHRRDSFSNHKLPLTLASMPCTVHHSLILTSASWVDSRRTQQAWIHRLTDFYHSMIIPGTTQENGLSAGKLIRQQLVNTMQLLPGEASRIVVEGFMPLPNQDSHKKIQTDQNMSNNFTDGTWVVLGYMSNFLDYPTRACRIKNNQHQFCHVIHGTICSVPETIAWQAMNAAQSSEGAIHIPASLAHHFPENYTDTNGEVLLPKVRSVEKSKQGRLKIGTIQPTLQTLSNQNHLSRSKGATVKKQQLPVGGEGEGDAKQLSMPRSPTALPDPLTNKQIRLEAMSSPFDFLPFYQ